MSHNISSCWGKHAACLRRNIFHCRNTAVHPPDSNRHPGSKLCLMGNIGHCRNQEENPQGIRQPGA